MKNLYCAENRSTKTLLTKTETKTIQTNLDFLIREYTKNATKVRMKKMLIFPLIPFSKNQFLTWSK